MIRKSIGMALIVMLLTACQQGPAPANEPTSAVNNEPTPAGNTAYPDISPTLPVQNSPYPDVNQPADQPVSPEDPNAGGPYPDPLAPIPGEENMQRGEVFIDESGIATMESFPPQFMLHLVGNLPTPCHHLRARVNEPDAQNQIHVEVYSLANPDEICTQVLKPFESNINLGSFKTGKYTVLVNGQKVANIDAP